MCCTEKGFQGFVKVYYNKLVVVTDWKQRQKCIQKILKGLRIKLEDIIRALFINVTNYLIFFNRRNRKKQIRE